MDLLKLLTAVGISAFLLASATPVLATGGCWEDECEPEPDPPKVKANNGWGNGAEGTNNGSDDGGTADSKTSESAVSGSPGPAKHGER